MNRTPRFLDIHVLQPVPYSNLNRDDTNSVKTVLYGDTLRTRVSSQSWKRAVREDFEREFGEKALRTRKIGERVTRYLKEEVSGWTDEEACRAGAHVAAGSSIKYEVAKDSEKKPIKNTVLTNALVYVPETAIAKLAALAMEHRDAIKDDFTGVRPKKGESAPTSVLPKKEIDSILTDSNGVIHLFGRMLAEVDNAGVDGSVQVAHAFTTHTTEVELDYFSAVDDVTLSSNDDKGSGHMGTAEFSAGTFYRFATVDLGNLLGHLGNERAAARELVEQFLQSFIRSLPQAKKNSTAAHTAPHLIHLVVRADRPLSFAAAFERPVHAAHGGGFSGESVTTLDTYADAANTLMGTDRLLHAGHASVAEGVVGHLGDRHASIEALVDAAVAAALPEEEQQ